MDQCVRAEIAATPHPTLRPRAQEPLFEARKHQGRHQESCALCYACVNFRMPIEFSESWKHNPAGPLFLPMFLSLTLCKSWQPRHKSPRRDTRASNCWPFTAGSKQKPIALWAALREFHQPKQNSPRPEREIMPRFQLGERREDAFVVGSAFLGLLLLRQESRAPAAFFIMSKVESVEWC